MSGQNADTAELDAPPPPSPYSVFLHESGRYPEHIERASAAGRMRRGDGRSAVP